MKQTNLSKIIKSSGCFDFIKQDAERAVSSLLEMHPDIMPFLSQEACGCLKDDFSERMELLYSQCLESEIQDAAQEYDPVGTLLGRFREEALQKAVQNIYAEARGAVRVMLHEKYPLIPEYRERIYNNYMGCFSDFCKAFLRHRTQISQRFLDGRTIGQILHLSTGGADLHRNGRCVIGVTTDAGEFYYKPHDCGMDMLYHEIISRWFSDCAAAADVIPGEAYAFVSCLVHEDVQKESGIKEYYYHFGVLSALFHGLGSIDLHYENMLAAGNRPACVDVETILCTPEKEGPSMEQSEPDDPRKIVADSLLRTCLLPVRSYKMPVISPLYAEIGESCLPEYEGRAYTIQGYEEEFRRGFHEGYTRMLMHREEIRALIDRYENTTVRCLLRNTSYYAIIHNGLFAPNSLRDEKSREKVREKLFSPFRLMDAQPDMDIINYEWSCLLKGDIPYYCTTAGSRDLCGEEPGQIIKAGYYKTSVRDSAFRFLDRLSEQEERFEQEMMRVCFANAPLHEKKEDRPAVIPGNAPSVKRLQKELSCVFHDITNNAVACTDGSLIWLSNGFQAESMQVLSQTVYGDIGMLAAKALALSVLPDSGAEITQLAERLCMQIEEETKRYENTQIEEETLQKVLPAGLFNGLGGLLIACREMAGVPVKGARELCARIVRLIAAKELYRFRKTSLAEGIAGLCIALSQLDPDEEGKHCIRFCAERLLEEELPDRDDAPYGRAGIGAALAAAYGSLKDERYAAGALHVFDKVHAGYKESLGGWPDGKTRLKWMADKGPYEAGIWLAADYAAEKLQGFEGAKILQEIRENALSCLLKQDTLQDLDTLHDGNALFVLALTKAGRIKEAGSILAVMLTEKERKGAFRVMPPGVRSSFDPSFYMGTTGILYAALVYLEKTGGA